MSETISIIAGLVSLAILYFKWKIDKEKEKKAKQDELDKEIDRADSFIDFVRIDDKLRDK